MNIAAWQQVAAQSYRLARRLADEGRIDHAAYWQRQAYKMGRHVRRMMGVET